jgi:hypothetical protein
MTIADQLSQAARAVVERWDSPLWKDLPHTAESINALRAALAAYDAAPDDDALVLVPREPTHAMLLAYAKAWDGYEIRGTTVGQLAAHEYKAMVAAAIAARSKP